MNALGFTFGTYIARVTLMAFLSVLAGTLVLIFVIDFVELLRQASDVAETPIAPLLLIALERTPAIAERALPFAILFGAMAAFLQLTRKLELVVARASGISAWQFLAPAAAVAFVVGIAFTTIYNPLSAYLNERSSARSVALLGDTSGTSRETRWIRQSSVDGQAILRVVAAADRGRRLSGVSIFAYDHGGRFVERIEADSALLEDGYWRLRKGYIHRPEREPEPFESYIFSTNLTPDQLSDSLTAVQSLSFWELPAMIAAAERSGLAATKYELQYHTLLARPAFLVAMVLIAATVSLRLTRLGGLARVIPSGIAAGFVLYVVTKLAEDLGGAGLVTPVAAAWTPAIVGLLMSLTVLLHQEDG